MDLAGLSFQVPTNGSLSAKRRCAEVTTPTIRTGITLLSVNANRLFFRTARLRRFRYFVTSMTREARNSSGANFFSDIGRHLQHFASRQFCRLCVGGVVRRGVAIDTIDFQRIIKGLHGRYKLRTMQYLEI